MTQLSADDRLAIIETLSRYSHCVDRGRWEEFTALFTPDCRLDLSQVLGCYEGRDGVGQFAAMMGSMGIVMRHFVTNVVVRDSDGVRADVECYVLAITGPPGSAQQSTGFYDDQLVKRDGRWLLHRRRLTLDVPSR